MASRTHDHGALVAWTGNTGSGTATYAGYGRSWRTAVPGKPDLDGSAEPIFGGDPARYNPEDLLLISVSTCHMLSYLALCARHWLTVLSYEDDAKGRMSFGGDGDGRFDEVVLHPEVTIAGGADAALAAELHERAHELCFIANSCRMPIRVEATIRAAATEAA
jgi:organic hydroperoxide reductase OsmC/OhrA